MMRKVDSRVVFSACIWFAALQVNRGNLYEAVADTLEDMNTPTIAIWETP